MVDGAGQKIVPGIADSPDGRSAYISAESIGADRNSHPSQHATGLISMVHETLTSLDPAGVLTQAKQFFAERVPARAAYPEKEGPTWLTLRGQGGEEIALAAIPAGPNTRVRASTLLFDQAVTRFLSILPRAGEGTA